MKTIIFALNHFKKVKKLTLYYFQTMAKVTKIMLFNKYSTLLII